MEKMNIPQICEYARYSECLGKLINDLHGKKILRLDYWSDYLGYVDIDVLMEKNL
jgi:hypothetical protein